MFNDKLLETLTKAKDKILEKTLSAPQIEISSNNHAVIQGADTVLEYDQNIIRIKLSTQEIQFWGNDFSIEYLTGDCVEIRGEINKVEFV